MTLSQFSMCGIYQPKEAKISTQKSTTTGNANFCSFPSSLLLCKLLSKVNIWWGYISHEVSKPLKSRALHDDTKVRQAIVTGKQCRIPADLALCVFITTEFSVLVTPHRPDASPATVLSLKGGLCFRHKTFPSKCRVSRCLCAHAPKLSRLCKSLMLIFD